MDASDILEFPSRYDKAGCSFPENLGHGTNQTCNECLMEQDPEWNVESRIVRLDVPDDRVLMTPQEDVFALRRMTQFFANGEVYVPRPVGGWPPDDRPYFLLPRGRNEPPHFFLGDPSDILLSGDRPSSPHSLPAPAVKDVDLRPKGSHLFGVGSEPVVRGDEAYHSNNISIGTGPSSSCGERGGCCLQTVEALPRQEYGPSRMTRLQPAAVPQGTSDTRSYSESIAGAQPDTLPRSPVYRALALDSRSASHGGEGARAGAPLFPFCHRCGHDRREEDCIERRGEISLVSTGCGITGACDGACRGSYLRATHEGEGDRSRRRNTCCDISGLLCGCPFQLRYSFLLFAVLCSYIGST
jgi:hypothetical protein